jgi:hypothetical protein
VKEGHLKRLNKQMLDENVPNKAAVSLADVDHEGEGFKAT